MGNFIGTVFKGEPGYLQLLECVQLDGERRTNRTGTDTLSVFGPQLRFDLGETFPIFTTKRVWWKGVAVELDWMLQGKGDIAYLREHDVTIWDEWASATYRPEMGYAEGELGPVYGVQWRRWQPPARSIEDHPKRWAELLHGALIEIPPSIDQIAQIVDKLRHHRDDRRIILSSWNVGEIDSMKLPPCHYTAQFLVDRDLGLTTIVSIRSWDLFLGAPFNVAQYALLTYVLAHVSGLVPRTLIMNAGDAHIYVNHLEQVDEQLKRRPSGDPRLVIDSVVHEIDDFRFHHALLRDYNPQAAIRGDVAI